MNFKAFALFLLIICSSCRALAQSCSGLWGAPIIEQTFGQGVAGQNYYTPLSAYAPGATTSTTFTTGYISDGFSELTHNVMYGQAANWINKTDHTGNPYGLMFLINAPSTSGTVFFEYTMNNLCPNTTMQLSVWVINANVGTLTAQTNYQYPNMAISVVDPATNTVLATTNTGDVAADSAWHNYTMIFNNGTNSSILLRLTNFSVGSGYGNDLAIDDIVVRPCVPTTKILPKTDTTVCSSTVIPFQAQVTNSPYNPVEYLWQYSNDMGATWTNAQLPGNNPSFNFAANTSSPGTYWIRFLTGPTGNAGNASCSAISDTAVVRVGTDPGPPVVNAVPVYCMGDPFVPFTTTAPNVKWYTTPIGGTGSTTAPVVNTSLPGTYVHYATQTDSLGCESVLRTTVTVTVRAPVNAAFSFSTRYGCSGDTVSFTNLSTDSMSYRWSFGDGTGDTARHPVHIYSSQGVFTVQLIAGDQVCADTVVQQVNLVHPLVASFTTDKDTICVGEAISFSNTSTTTSRGGIDPTWSWDFGNGDTSTLQNPVVTFPVPGTYEVRMAVRDFVPCSDTAFKTIVVDSMSFADFKISDSSICRGDAITFSADYLAAGNTGLSWDFGDGTGIAGINPVRHSYDSAGTYTVTFSASYRICPDTGASKEVTVRPFPKLDLGPDTVICLYGEPVVLTAVTDPPGLSDVRWSTNDTATQILVRHHGTFFARVDLDGCTVSDTVEVRKDCYIDVPNAFTPNGDGVNDFFFPRQYLSKKLSRFRMQVFNRWGQLVFETDKTDGRGWDGRFNNTDQPQGVYVFLIDAELAGTRQEKYQGNVTLIR